MDKDTQELARLLEEEHERSYNHLCKKLGKEKVDKIYELMDEILEKKIRDSFENFVEIKQEWRN